ncbi:2-hydroxyacyl-CoA dehydratase subunit D [Fusibacter ferrireducens]|uniref:2-hydroxyacyl-CoA dehydratase n=1 Tax=Fusibacter ferrireducens TaxID=2785058 RepID=A0ABR9ZYT9_9FIRM|nr:2-hydroxyacyl-CoA dehydratase family protein [Fusibacter ferrireducens]MBF4695055.1 2-hydroxyacyl-CoA dehydratase [Fusibacter ferrireducens]
MSEVKEVKPKRELPLSRIMVNEQTAQVYAEAWAASEKGEPIGWSTAIFPQELCETFGVPLVYPENNAASISAKKLGEPFIEHAEGHMRYPINICSYARLNLGMADKIIEPGWEKVEPAMPVPTFLCLANNSCTQLMKWYENLSRNLNIPIFFMDCLYNYDEEEPAPHKIKYLKKQLENNIKKMEVLFNKKFDWDKFLEVQKRSQINRKLFNEIVALNARKPSPMNGFDLFNYMSCLVLCRGKASTTRIFEQLKREIEAHIQNGTSTYGSTPEAYRVHWEGIACWPNLGFNLKTLRKYGVNCVMNGYVTAWDVAYEPGDLEGMAKAYQCSSTNSFSTSSIMDMRTKSIEAFGCEGMLCHVNRSCKLMTFHIFVGRDMIEEKAKIPSTNFDGDQSDTRVFSEAQFETRLQGLVEIMKANKEAEL